MTREEFESLPPMIALGIVYDLARPKLEQLERPAVPRSPLYDGRLSRGSKGFVWMSEMVLRDLEWWQRTKQQSADNGGQYAEKDGKTAQTLGAWIAWRRLFPHEVWSGKRGDARAAAMPPSPNPPLNDWPSSNGSNSQPSKSSRPSPDDDGRGEEEEPSYGF